MKRPIIVISFCALWLAAHSQNEFEWGMGTSSLEPGGDQLSLSLAGYGLPADGRFSLTWDKIKETPPVQALTNHGTALIMSGSGGIFSLPADSYSSYTVLASKIKGVMDLTSGEAFIYMLREKEVVKTALAGNQLKIISKIPLKNSGIYKIVCYKGQLYGIGVGHHWFRLDGRSVWTKLEKAGETRSICATKQHVYILKADGTMWYGRPGEADSWKQNGRENEFTWKPHMISMTALNNRLYGISDSGVLYRSRHSSDSSLTVSSLVIRKNNKTVVITGVDVCGLPYSFTQTIKDSLKAKFGIAPEAVLINSSHTHFAPVTQEWKAWAHYYHSPDSSYLYSTVLKGIISSVEKSIHNLSPGSLSFVRGNTNIGKNRRSQANPEAPYDPSLDMIKLSRKNDKLESLLFLTGCHPVFPNAKASSFTLSANYPGVARKLIAEQLKLDQTLFLQGCGGDINPVKPDYRETGKDLTEDVIRSLKQQSSELSGEISYRFDSLLVPVKFWTKEKLLAFRKENADRGKDIYAEKNVRWADIMLHHLKMGTAPSYMPIYIQTINIGNWLLIGLSREVVTEYGINIKKQWPDKMISVAGYSNDVSSYLPIDWHIRTGVYEGNESSFWYAQPDLFPENILELVMEKVRSMVL